MTSTFISSCLCRTRGGSSIMQNDVLLTARGIAKVVDNSSFDLSLQCRSLFKIYQSRSRVRKEIRLVSIVFWIFPITSMTAAARVKALRHLIRRGSTNRDWASVRSPGGSAEEWPRPYLHTYLSLGQGSVVFRTVQRKERHAASLARGNYLAVYHREESLIVYYANSTINHPFLFLRTVVPAFSSARDFSNDLSLLHF